MNENERRVHLHVYLLMSVSLAFFWACQYRVNYGGAASGESVALNVASFASIIIGVAAGFLGMFFDKDEPIWQKIIPIYMLSLVVLLLVPAFTSFDVLGRIWGFTALIFLALLSLLHVDQIVDSFLL